jgi:hypothetical protein
MNTHGYRQLSFAAPLKQLVIELDPVITYELVSGSGAIGARPVPLSVKLDSGLTFEECKRTFPEVRRVLQRIGQGMRRLDPDYWVRLLMNQLDEVPEGTPVVIADMRYRNEADALRAAKFRLVRIDRVYPHGMTTAETRASLHSSETDLDHYRHDDTLKNDGQLVDLISRVLDLI